MTQLLPILSVRQPWASAIIHAGKDIENRSRPTKLRGRILIHASLHVPKKTEIDRCIEVFSKTSLAEHYEHSWIRWYFNRIIPNIKGGIVGSVEIIDCIDEDDERAKSPWFIGKYGYVLKNPKFLPLLPLKGRLGFFTDPATAALSHMDDAND
jgi:hypothetical protein